MSLKSMLVKLENRFNKAAIALKSIFGQKARTAVVAVACLASATSALAYTAPAGGWAQEVYDLAITNILQGPIGFVGGVGAMAAGAISFLQQRIFVGVICMTAGAILMNAENLVTALGALF